MKYSVLILLLFLAIACNKKSESNQSPQNVAPGATANPAATASLGDYQVEPLEGSDLQLAAKKSAAGFPAERGYMLNGKREGAWMTYHDIPGDEGRLKSLATYRNDKLEGVYLEFSNKGQVKLIAHYVNDLLDGQWARYEWGATIEEADYKAGQMHGVYKQYGEGSKLLKEIQFVNGKQDGFFRQYDDTGKLVIEYQYKNGEKVGGGLVK
jgi:hypothetical protein